MFGFYNIPDILCMHAKTYHTSYTSQLNNRYGCMLKNVQLTRITQLNKSLQPTSQTHLLTLSLLIYMLPQVFLPSLFMSVILGIIYYNLIKFYLNQ